MKAIFLAVLLAGCGDPDSDELPRTVATVHWVRGDLQLGDEPLGDLGRASPGTDITTGAGGLARVQLDWGPALLVDGGSSVSVSNPDERHIALTGGRVFLDAQRGAATVATEDASVRTLGGSLSARLRGDTLEVYVVSGEAAYRLGEVSGTAAAGQRVLLGEGEARIEDAILWSDWTGGLARAGGRATRSRGVGVLEARVPGEPGRAHWPLVIRRLDVRLRVVGDLAITEVDQVFFNPASETVEGRYRLSVPRTAVLQRFAVDRNGQLVDGYLREKAQARQAYEQQVYRGSTDDPALLEWDAPGAYRARIYPIGAGETRRIVVRYAEWLNSTDRGTRRYRYPLGSASVVVQEFSFQADLGEARTHQLRVGMEAEVTPGQVRVRRSDFRPTADLWLELIESGAPLQRAWTAAHSPPLRDPNARAVPAEADENDYWYLPLRLTETLLGVEELPAGIDIVVVTDVSAGTDRSHLELGSTVVEALASHLGEDDRIAVVTSDLTIRSLEAGGPALGPTSDERLSELLYGLARAPGGGATDLGAALGAAAGLLDPSRRGAVVYVGDGAPTVGELGAEGLLDHFARLPNPARLYAVGVGDDANLELLSALTAGGGLALRVQERSAAAGAALDVLAHAGRPLAQRVTVDVGTGVDHVFPRRPVDVVLGEVLPVSGRIQGSIPSEVTVRGELLGEPFETTISVTTGDAASATDLRLRWASERLRELLLQRASREEIADLGTRYGLITPFVHG
ncbi:MAG: VIT domain-containing protein [Myxococcota bacterium]